MIVGAFVFSLGRWPHDHFYNYYSVMTPLLIVSRYVEYKPRRWHYFLVDYCVYGSVIVWLYVTFFPKNETFYRLAFLYSCGTLAVSTAAFQNPLVFHKADHLVSLSTHAVPIIVLWNVRHVTMPYEKDLPEN